jgi:para-nitrobenzyl esterase
MGAAALWLGASGALLAGEGPPVVERPIAGDPVQIDSGAIAGKQLASGVRAYFGIPYAAPPVRDLRWREPQPVQSWQGTFVADRKAPECIQNLRAHDINHYFGEEATSEDCLYVNVWAPPTAHASGDLSGPANDSTARAKQPVLVWIHGGGFTIGSSGMANYDGEMLARKGAVFVSFNYRLGLVGFMAHPQLTAESPHHASGNYGHLDQVAALQWIHRNIAAFGGDPANVTIMGQSAGSMSVLGLQASPLTASLFQHAVGMSGGPGLGPPSPTLEEGEQIGLKYQAALKAASLAEMRQLPADKLLAIQNQCSAGCGSSFQARPIVDGFFLPESALERVASGKARDIPLILGFTHDESWNELRSATTVEQFRQSAARIFGDQAGGFLKLYRPATQADVSRLAADAVRDGGMATVMRGWARAHKTAAQASVFLYVYSHPHRYAPDIKFSDHDPATAGAYHASEVPFFLQTLDALNLFRTTRNWTDHDRELAERMADCLVAFARSGNPSTAQVAWPPYQLNKERLVEFGNQVRVVEFDTTRMNFMATAHMPFGLGVPAAQRRSD